MRRELITDMSKGLSADSQVHISVAFLIKAMIGISMLIATYYQVQIRFAEHENRIKELENKITVLNASIEGMETQHIEGKEYDVESLTDEQKIMVNHVLDLDRKLQSSEFNIVQLRFGRQAFSDALKVSLDETSSEKDSE